MAKAMAGNGGVAVEMEATRLQVCRLQRGFGWRGFYSFGLEARRREISEDETLNSYVFRNLGPGLFFLFYIFFLISKPHEKTKLPLAYPFTSRLLPGPHDCSQAPPKACVAGNSIHRARVWALWCRRRILPRARTMLDCYTHGPSSPTVPLPSEEGNRLGFRANTFK